MFYFFVLKHIKTEITNLPCSKNVLDKILFIFYARSPKFPLYFITNFLVNVWMLTMSTKSCTSLAGNDAKIMLKNNCKKPRNKMNIGSYSVRSVFKTRSLVEH